MCPSNRGQELLVLMQSTTVSKYGSTILSLVSCIHFLLILLLSYHCGCSIATAQATAILLSLVPCEDVISFQQRHPLLSQHTRPLYWLKNGRPPRSQAPLRLQRHQSLSHPRWRRAFLDTVGSANVVPPHGTNQLPIRRPLNNNPSK